MTDDLAEVRDELRQVARGLLAGTRPEGGDAPRPSPEQWARFADAGWLGLEAPAACDGSDVTIAELAVVVEELGRATAASPFLGSVVLAGGLLGDLEPTAERDDLWRRLVAGEAVVAAAVADGDPTSWPPAVPFQVEPADGAGVRVHGQARFVPDAVGADEVLLLATGADGTPAVVRLPAGHPGLTVDDQPLLDATRSSATVAADGAQVPADAVWRFADDPVAAARRVVDRGAWAVAVDSLGLSRALLEATVGYAGTREQFGRAIGSFQAVKHQCADMQVSLTVVEHLVALATQALAAGDPDAGLAVSRAKAQAGAVGVEVAGTALQLHGGVGYTWESGLHVAFKRAVLNRSLFGSPRAHRRRVAAQLVSTG